MPTHTENRVMPYTARQIYDLVADVLRYPEFIPWISAARIRSVTPHPDGTQVMQADLVVSFKAFREKFGSIVVLNEQARRIDIDYLDGPFRHLRSRWEMRDVEGGCEVRFFVDFEFRNMILQKLIGVVFNEAMQRIVRAFERRAEELYGTRAEGV
ncbi:MAG: type II toxin-antitoxin system RatA family toxin [Alphaproteobacteria bacterium]|nr:MAG: type II toxin-antitoxin system RatA family toxin [Alphaproteobacteria bacterium]